MYLLQPNPLYWPSTSFMAIIIPYIWWIFMVTKHFFMHSPFWSMQQFGEGERAGIIIPDYRWGNWALHSKISCSRSCSKMTLKQRTWVLWFKALVLFPAPCTLNATWTSRVLDLFSKNMGIKFRCPQFFFFSFLNFFPWWTFNHHFTLTISSKPVTLKFVPPSGIWELQILPCFSRPL